MSSEYIRVSFQSCKARFETPCIIYNGHLRAGPEDIRFFPQLSTVGASLSLSSSELLYTRFPRLDSKPNASRPAATQEIDIVCLFFHPHPFFHFHIFFLFLNTKPFSSLSAVLFFSSSGNYIGEEDKW
jgi:hypothetical protein